jgi:ArsR family transcriptional regulator, cadmium/lead-responsive transcriptional repressor
MAPSASARGEPQRAPRSSIAVLWRTTFTSRQGSIELREKRECELATVETATGASIEPLGDAERDVLARFFRGLGDPTRLALLQFLADGERNVTECVKHAGLSQGRVSVHLSCLTECGFVCVRREGRFAYYSIADQAATDLLIAAWSMIADKAAGISGCEQVAAAK